MPKAVRVPGPPPVQTRGARPRPFLLVSTGLALAALLAWDMAGFDVVLARMVGTSEGFPWRNHWMLTFVLHDGARRIAWVLAAALCIGVRWPVGPLRRLDLGARLQLAVTPLVASFVISALKSASFSSCPWDLDLFGGVARYASHWSAVADGGPGRCFPAGHAAAGFSFIGGYLVFRHVAPAIARAWLIASLAAGAVLGLAQQARGAHFMSHTLWTAFICWCIGLAAEAIRRRHAGAAGQGRFGQGS